MPSPSKPSDFSNLVLTSSSTLCDRFKAALLTLPSKLYDFVNYVLDDTGKPSTAFAKDLLENTGIWLVGEIKQSASTTTPVGWVEFEGQALSRSTYSELFAVTGESYGGGDGSTTFNVPDLRGYVLMGRNESSNQAADLKAVSLGDITGDEEVSLENRNYPDSSFEVTGYAMAHGTHTSKNVPESSDLERYRERLGYALYHEDSGHRSEPSSFDTDGSTLLASTYGEAKIDGAEGAPISVVQPSFAVRHLIYTGYYPS